MASEPIPDLFKGATVTTIQRASARVLLALPEAILAGMIVLQLRVRIDDAWLVPCTAVFGVWFLINTVLLLFQSRTVPATMLGFEYRSVRTGQRAGGKAFLGRLLTTLMFYASLGVMGVVLSLTHRNGQSLVDRWLGLVAVHPKQIRDAFDPTALAPKAPPARVQQVTMPGMVSSPPVGPQQPGSSPGVIVASPFAPPRATPSPSFPVATPPAPVVDETELDACLCTPEEITIQLDDDTLLTLDAPVVLGRNPVAPEGFREARLVDLEDPSMKLSKTHIVVVAEGGRVKVRDIGSCNGVVFELNETKMRIPPQQVIEVPDQATVHFGGRSFKVVS